jgi:hypothetical protein
MYCTRVVALDPPRTSNGQSSIHFYLRIWRLEPPQNYRDCNEVDARQMDREAANSTIIMIGKKQRCLPEALRVVGEALPLLP